MEEGLEVYHVADDAKMSTNHLRHHLSGSNNSVSHGAVYKQQTKPCFLNHVPHLTPSLKKKKISNDVNTKSR